MVQKHYVQNISLREKNKQPDMGASPFSSAWQRLSQEQSFQIPACTANGSWDHPLNRGLVSVSFVWCHF